MAVEITSGRGIYRYTGTLTASAAGSLTIALSGDVERIQRREFVRVAAHLDVTVQRRRRGRRRRDHDARRLRPRHPDHRQVEPPARASTCASSSSCPTARRCSALGRVVRVGPEDDQKGIRLDGVAARRRRSADALHPRPRGPGAAGLARLMAKEDDKEGQGGEGRQARAGRLDRRAPAREGRHPPRPHARRADRLRRSSSRSTSSATRTLFDAVWRALLAGIVVNVVVWRFAIVVWRHIVSEVRRARGAVRAAERMEKLAAEQTTEPHPEDPI